METVSATEFKAHCLQLMERVRKTRKPVLITKRGMPLAQLVPPPATEERPWQKLRGSVLHMGDVLSPVVVDEDIQALK